MISVIVPIYNVEKYLEKCIQSIINQTYRNLEIILVDDGSTDNSGEIADKYKKLDNRIKVIHKINGGLSDARNKGCEIATGEYISFIDSDDYIDLNMYENLIKEFKDNIDIIVYGRYVEFENYTRIECPDNSVMNNREALIALDSFKGFDMAAWDKLYRKEVIKDLKFPFGKKNEDYFYTYKAFDKAKRIKTMSKPFYHYVQRQNSISRSKNVPFDAIEGSREQVEYFEKNHPDLIEIAYTTLFFSYVSIYNVCVRQNIELNVDQRKKFKKECKKIIKYILKNEYISTFKKIQAVLFIISFQLYKIIFKLNKN